jgi:hypothetical protein
MLLFSSTLGRGYYPRPSITSDCFWIPGGRAQLKTLPNRRRRLSKDSRLPSEGLLKKSKDASNCDNAVKKRNSED